MDKRKFNIIYIINTFLDIQRFLTVPVFAIYLSTKLNFSVTLSSVITSSGFVGSIAGCFIVPILVNKLRHKKLLAITIITQGLLTYLLSIISSFYVLALINGLIGFCYSIMTSNIQAIISLVFTGEEVKSAFAKRTVASNLGISIGVMLSGVLKDNNLLIWCFILPLIIASISFLLIITFIKGLDKYFRPSDKKSFLEALKTTVTNKKLHLFNLISFVFYITYSSFLLGLPLFVNDTFSHFNIGTVYLVNTLTIVFLQVYVIKYITQKLSTLKVLFLGSISITLSYVLFFLSHNVFVLMLAVVIFTLGEVLVIPLIPSFISDNSDKNEIDFNISSMMVVRYVGLSVGQIAAGSVIDYVSKAGAAFRFNWIAFAAIAGITSLSFYIYSIYDKKLSKKYKIAQEIDNAL